MYSAKILQKINKLKEKAFNNDIFAFANLVIISMLKLKDFELSKKILEEIIRKAPPASKKLDVRVWCCEFFGTFDPYKLVKIINNPTLTEASTIIEILFMKLSDEKKVLKTLLYELLEKLEKNVSLDNDPEKFSFIEILCDIFVATKDNQILRKALKVAQDIEEETTQVAAFGEIALGLLEIGRIHEGEEILKKALKLAEKQIPYEVATILCEISVRLAYIDMFDMALKVVELIDSPLDEMEALKDIASRLAKKGKFDEALKIARKLNDFFLTSRSKALHTIAVEMAKAGLINRALDIIQEIIKTGKYPDNICHAIKGIDSIAWITKDKSLLEMALKYIEEIKNPRDKSYLLADTAHIFAKLDCLDTAMNLLNKAIKYAKKIKDEDSKSETFGYIAMHFAALEMFDKALEIVKKIRSDYWKINTLLSMIEIKLGILEFELLK